LLFGRKKPQNSESGLGEEAYGLKREVGVWGSFSMGYADVGADVYVALGILALYAHAAAPIALLLASITYVTTGLTYAELSTKYPVAGGGQFYALKAFGPLHGFLAGWGLMLDYTIDIALFALATSGYLSALSSVFTHTGILLQPPWYSVIAIIVIAALLLLNISGIRYSSKFNELVVALNIVTFVVIVALGLYTVFASGGFARWTSQLEPNFLTSDNFVYSLTLAMASFIGIESISQAAEETKSPNKVIPKSTKLSIVAVMTVALALSFLSVSLQPWQVTASSAQNPLFSLTASLPVIGLGLSAWVAVTGFLMSAVSTNTGVIGVSRVTFSMGRLDLMPRAFSRIHKKYKTPYVTIALFSVTAASILVFNLFLPGETLLNLVASLYNFGALITYLYVNLSAVVLRFKAGEDGGSYKTPLNVTVPYRGRKVRVSLVPIVGFISCGAMWAVLVASHPVGRLVGFGWFIVGIAMYFMYRKRRELSPLR
jgi:APA family basic amino acid/polyamine antiporter